MKSETRKTSEAGAAYPPKTAWKWTKNTFFFITEEGYRQAQPLTGTGRLVVPTAFEAAGNFTQNPVTLYDPTSPAELATRVHVSIVGEPA